MKVKSFECFILAVCIFLVTICCGCTSSEVKEESTEIADYELYFGKDSAHRQSTLISPDIFPQALPASYAEAEFLYSYYNPWDPCYVSFLTYTCNESDYEQELKRLEDIGIQSYANVYGIQDFPYPLSAAKTSDYGIIYAMCIESEKRLVYVEITFCNYFSDIDYTKKIAPEYLPVGFDAKKGNETQMDRQR